MTSKRDRSIETVSPSKKSKVSLPHSTPRSKAPKIGAFLFHRSLRLDDNRGLLAALEGCDSVVPIFCVDPRQADPEKNPYHSLFALNFMTQSLQDLREVLQGHGSDLLVPFGEPHVVLPKLMAKLGVTHVVWNEDYTPFAIARSKDIHEAMKAEGITTEEVLDVVLHPPGSVKTQDGGVFKVFTPFYDAAMPRRVSEPIPFNAKHAAKLTKRLKTLDTGMQFLVSQTKGVIPTSAVGFGGRSEALGRLHASVKTQDSYHNSRDYLLYNTSHMSAAIQFGCVSIREAWYTWGGKGSSINRAAGTELRRELIWREFFTHMSWAYPAMLEWNYKPKKAIVLDKKAPTLVRACYHELVETGWLHNRGRMILAGYLVHQQKVYWKDGAAFFARHEVDYAPMINDQSWLRESKLPSFRQLKPERQQEKFDGPSPYYPDTKSFEGIVPKGAYCRRWADPEKATAALKKAVIRK